MSGSTNSEPFHVFGSDLVLGANGDLLLVNGPLEVQQRVLRRLLTNQGDYIWVPDYGAGLPSRIGRKANAQVITALIRSQIFEEAEVAQTPAPTVNVTVSNIGAVTATITFFYLPTSQPVTLSFQVPTTVAS